MALVLPVPRKPVKRWVEILGGMGVPYYLELELGSLKTSSPPFQAASILSLLRQLNRRRQ